MQDDSLAKIEAIRLQAYHDIKALGFNDDEVSVDVSLFSMSILHVARQSGWHDFSNWYESPIKAEGGEITVYCEWITGKDIQ